MFVVAFVQTPLSTVYHPAMSQRELHCDVLVAGGGTGGVAAALAAADLGRSVVIVEPYPWLGGQLTSQAVPPDEHPWVESHGRTARYAAFREGVRDYYRRHYPLTPAARRDPKLNPGGGDVSRLCFEPRVGAAVIDQMLAAHRASGRIRVLYGLSPISADVGGGRVRAVTFSRAAAEPLMFDDSAAPPRHDDVVVSAAFVLDATETGDLLPLTGTAYALGGEAQSETGEPHARPDGHDPDDVQGLTWCAAVGFEPGVADDRHLIDRPADYDRWRAYAPELDPPYPGRLLDWQYDEPSDTFCGRGCLRREDRSELGEYPLFLYRRIIGGGACDCPIEVTMLNWPQNDYWGGKLVDEPAEIVRRRLGEARELTRCVLYWLQNDAPRGDGVREAGYPELHLRPDVAGTADGLCMAPYHREGRRLLAVTVVKEQDVTAGPAAYADSVGVGCYRLDLHPSCAGRGSMYAPTWPYQIPLGALLPADGPANLVAAGKCIGTTHLTNGCYRLHPTEWNVGESAGTLAAFCLARDTTPAAVRADAELLGDYQRLLRDEGVELAWPAVRAV